MDPSTNRTAVDRQTSNGSTRAGERPLIRTLTDLCVDGQVVDTIIWSAPLLRRLEREGKTREDYIAERLEMVTA